MESKREVRRLSDGQQPAIHSYFDLCPESPDGMKVVYFEWLDKIPGLGYVTVCEREGGNPRSIGEELPGFAHGGAYQQWLDNDAIASAQAIQGEPKTVIVSQSDGSRREVPGALRMYSAQNSFGITSSHETRMLGGKDDAERIYLIDLDHAMSVPLISCEAVMKMHPLKDRVVDPARFRFKHTKWAPTGEMFLFVFYGKRGGADEEEGGINSVFVARADGGDCRYLGEVGHDPMWDPEGAFIYAYCRNERSRQDVVAIPLDGGPTETVLADVPGSHASLSPDKTQLVTDVMNWPGKGRGALLLYDLQSGEFDPIVHMDLPEAISHPHPVWSRDGRRIYFCAAENGLPQVYAVSL